LSEFQAVAWGGGGGGGCNYLIIIIGLMDLYFFCIPHTNQHLQNIVNLDVFVRKSVLGIWPAFLFYAYLDLAVWQKVESQNYVICVLKLPAYWNRKITQILSFPQISDLNKKKECGFGSAR
jgi:hypothetical protein